jgi:4-aminobutyrate aminotransferase-like enzyme
MTLPLKHPHEPASNSCRETITRFEPRALRTYTPSLAAIAKSAGVFHWTPEGRQLYDFTSGVLVANLGHNLVSWSRRLAAHMGWPAASSADTDFFPALPLTAYNALTTVEAEAAQRLITLLQERPGGRRLEQIMWAASGSEAVQKALWAALAHHRERDIILATRHGFHGKKGLAAAVTGCETDPDRDPRVRFIRFPMEECADVSLRDRSFDATPYHQELAQLVREFGRRIGVLITEPYLGGAGSYHPPRQYLQLLQRFCREHDIIFILDEIQSNFGRTGTLFAFESYGLEPDMVVLGKSLGNGVPVAAAVGSADLFAALQYGEGSDTWSGNPLSCAATLATLDEYKSRNALGHCRRVSPIIEAGLMRLKRFPFIAHVRGECGGMVWGVETRDYPGRAAASWANEVVRACYCGDNSGLGIHLLGPLANKVIRIAPPLLITEQQATHAMNLMENILTGIDV